MIRVGRKVVMKRMIYIGATVAVLLLLAWSLVGCGGSAGMSAPPVDLPTPVTGRITVSSPDANGNISVIGESGAVTADSTVMAINETVAVSSNLYLDVLSLFIGTAHAQSGEFPDVCLETGHECALADADGAFELTIAGEEEDSIAIVVIDSDTGDERSERLRKPVPTNLFRIPIEGIDRPLPIIDIAINPLNLNELYLLLEGGTINGTAVDHRLAFFNTMTREVESIDLDMSDVFDTPAGLVVGQVFDADSDTDIMKLGIIGFDSAGVISAVVADMLFGGTGRVSATDFTSTVELFENSSLALTDLLDGSLASFGDADGSGNTLYSINKRADTILTGFDFNDGRATELSISIDSTEFGEYKSAIAMATGGFDAIISEVIGDPVETSLVAILAEFDAEGSDGSSSSTTRLIITREVDDLFSRWLTVSDAAVRAGNFADLIVTSVALPSGAEAEDVEFLNTSGDIMVTDIGNDAVYIYSLLSGPTSCPASPHICFSNERVSITGTNLINPLEIAATEGYAFVTANNGDETRPDTVITIDLSDNSIVRLSPVGLMPTGIVYDDAHEILYVSNYISRNIARFTFESLIVPE